MNQLPYNGNSTGKIQVIRTIEEIRNLNKELRDKGKVIGLVPTMGALHKGHFELVKRSIEQCDYTIATIFVNPIQFGENEDFDTYPRQEKEDIFNLESIGCNAVFAPSVEEMFSDYMPNPQKMLTVVSVSELTDGLCGSSRPGHFDGVTTEVLKTFMIVLPDKAYFGEKDYQQLMVVRQMVRDLSVPVHIESVPTVREDDGLAVSSRNQYLTKDQRKLAPVLYTELKELSIILSKKQGPYNEILEKSKKNLIKKGFDKVDYLSIVDKYKLTPIDKIEGEARLLVAAWIGRTRLIDNIAVNCQ